MILVPKDLFDILRGAAPDPAESAPGAGRVRASASLGGAAAADLVDGGGVEEARAVDVHVERDGAPVREAGAEPPAEEPVVEPERGERAAGADPVAVVGGEPEVHGHALRVRPAAEREVHEFFAAEIFLARRVDERPAL